MPFDLLHAAGEADNKYSRGVVGFITGSEQYPGAAILGVSAAIRSGVGMVRYLGPAAVANRVLLVRPEIVTQVGSVDSWVLGSGVSDVAVESLEKIRSLLAKLPSMALVIDAGALALVEPQMFEGSLAILTPHLGEAKKLATALGCPFDVETAEPEMLSKYLVESTGATVVLKGHRTLIADIRGVEAQPASPTVLATAGTGDVLAGLLGALCAINAEQIASGQVSLFDVAKVAVAVHSLAAEIASAGAPIAALDVADAIGKAVAKLRVK